MNLVNIMLLITATSVAGLITPLQALVSSQAFVSSITSGISREIGTDSLIVNALFKSHYHPELDIIYTGIIGLTMANSLDSSTINKETSWANLDIYKKIQKKTRVVVLIIMAVFIKNIENAV